MRTVITIAREARKRREPGYTRAGMARAERVEPSAGRPVGGAFVAAGLALAAVGARRTSSSAAARPHRRRRRRRRRRSRATRWRCRRSRATPLPLRSAPRSRGRRWVYPIGPPVRGLPNVVANIKSDLYEVFAINYSCKQASEWIRKLSRLADPGQALRQRHRAQRAARLLLLGLARRERPRVRRRLPVEGWRWLRAAEERRRHQYPNGRGCKLTGGNKAFGWNWNVANRRVVFAHDDKGVLHLIHVSGSDTNVIFRYLNGSYQLQVLNTSGIGYLNGFTWTPSPGWTVTRIKSSSGATCSRHTRGEDLLHRHRQSAELPLHGRRRQRVGRVHRHADEEERRLPVRRLGRLSSR